MKPWAWVLVGIAAAILLYYFTRPKTNGTTVTVPAPDSAQRTAIPAPAPAPTPVIQVRYAKRGLAWFRELLQNGSVISSEEITRDQFIEAIGGASIYCTRYTDPDYCQYVRGR